MKHLMMPIDKGGYSHKFNYCALKYEIAMDIFTSKVVWIWDNTKQEYTKNNFQRDGLKGNNSSRQLQGSC
jgi:hypothetical protein